MMTFWLLAAAMLAAALTMVLPPLLQTSTASAQSELDGVLHRSRMGELEADLANGLIADAEYEQARRELERAALEVMNTTAGTSPSPATANSPIVAVVIALAVPTVSFGLYLTLGTPHAVGSASQQASAAASASSTGAAAAEDEPQHSLAEMVGRLEARLEQQPDDATGWGMLGRSYAAMNRLQDSRAAYARAAELDSNDPQLLVDYAELIAQLNDGDLNGEASTLLQAALKLSPDHPKGLWLSGVAAFQRGEFETAVASLERFRSLVDLDPEQARVVNELIDRVRNGTSMPIANAEDADTPAVKLAVSVSLVPELAARAVATDTVFVFARAVEGPRMPLAIVRKQVADLPMTVTLDDSLAMTPAVKLSDFDEVIVGARVSKSGMATPNSGDLRGGTSSVSLARVRDVEVEIDEVIP